MSNVKYQTMSDQLLNTYTNKYFYDIYKNNVSKIKFHDYLVQIGKKFQLNALNDPSIIDQLSDKDIYTNHMNYINDLSNLNISSNQNDQNNQIDQNLDYMNPPQILYDPYYWLRDNSKTDQDVLDVLHDENKLTNKVMKPTEAIQTELYNELLSYVEETYQTYAVPRNEWNSPYKYYVSISSKSPYLIHHRICMSTQIREILLDENELADYYSTDLFSVSGFNISSNHKYMLFGVDTNGSEDYEMHIIDIDTKMELEHSMPKLPYADYIWINDTIYYILVDDERRQNKIIKYNIYTQNKIEIYHNPTQTINVSIGLSSDKQFLIISADSSNTHDKYLLNLKPNNLSDESSNKPIQFTKCIKGLKYLIEHSDDKFFIITNSNNATNFKLMWCSDILTDQSHWIDVETYDELINLYEIKILKNHILILYKSNGNSHIKVYEKTILYEYLSQSTKIIKSIDLSHQIVIQNVKSIDLVDLDIYDTTKIILSYSDLKTPYTCVQYDIINKSYEIVHQKIIPNYNSELYHTEQLYAKSLDDVLIPISIIYRKNKFTQNSTNPLYLYGYGAYGITIDPMFDSELFPLLDRGFVYAIAHVRGGGFFGNKWYENGKLLHKMNSFYDFISVCEHLIQIKYVDPAKISIEGKSAGGLLVCASMILRPDLFNTVIADIPFVDIITTMSDPSIPLTIPEWKEWGNPNKHEFFNYMIKYSPYDNIKSHISYPNILALSGLHDPRVQYWESVKFIAKLRNPDPNPNSNPNPNPNPKPNEDLVSNNQYFMKQVINTFRVCMYYYYYPYSTV